MESHEITRITPNVNDSNSLQILKGSPPKMRALSLDLMSFELSMNRLLLQLHMDSIYNLLRDHDAAIQPVTVMLPSI